MNKARAVAAAVLVAGSFALAWEVGEGVDHVAGQNVVHLSREKLDFKMEATKSQDGSILAKMVIPATSELMKASYLRLEIIEGSKILLWSRLHEYPQADGSRMVAFQIHQDLVGKAWIGISYDAGITDEFMHAYKVPIVQYVTDTRPAPTASRPSSRPG